MNIMTWYVLKIKRLELDMVLTKPLSSKPSFNLSNQALGVYLRPYKAFFTLPTK